jgi:hypothetical protein
MRTPKVQQARERSRRYLQLAQSYGRAAGQIASMAELQEARSPFFMLVSHAAELSLKALIAAGGADDERLLVLGHDLQLCMRLARKQGLAGDLADPKMAAIVDALGPPHMAQAFRYPCYLSWSLPKPVETLEALEWLLTRTQRVVSSAVQPEERTKAPAPSRHL